MNFDEARRIVESNEFAARVGIASDLRTLLAAASQQAAVSQLWSMLIHDIVKVKLVKRVGELAAENVDLRFRNPCDIALAVYLWLISVRDRSLADIAAESLLNARQCFWATNLARECLLRSPVYSNTVEKTFVVEAKSENATPISASNTDTVVFYGVVPSSSNRDMGFRGSLMAPIGLRSASNAVAVNNGGDKRAPFNDNSSIPVLDQAA